MRKDLIHQLNKIYQSPKANKFFARDELNFSDEVKKFFKRFESEWNKNFSIFGIQAVEQMIKEANREADLKLNAIFQDAKNAGIEVNFKIGAMPQSVKNVLYASTAEAAALIKSIPQQYLQRVQGEVYRSITSNKGSWSALVKEIEHLGALSRRRAIGIAKDQTKKSFSALNLAKAKVNGIKKGIWIHSGSPKHPRIKHKNFSGQVFDLDKGAPIGDKGQYVFPAEEPFCSCIWKPVLTF